jgi:hypothetical protein
MMSNLTEMAKENGAEVHIDDTGRNDCYDYIEFTPAQLIAYTKAVLKEPINAMEVVEEVLGGEDGWATENAPYSMKRVNAALSNAKRLVGE